MQHVRRMQEHARAETIYFWGQEFAIYTAVQQGSSTPVAVTEESIRFAVEDVVGLPLLIPHDRNYPQMIDQIIRNRIERR